MVYALRVILLECHLSTGFQVDCWVVFRSAYMWNQCFIVSEGFVILLRDQFSISIAADRKIGTKYQRGKEILCT